MTNYTKDMTTKDDDVFDMMGKAMEMKYDEVGQLKVRLAEAEALFHEAIDNYPIETDPKLWTSRVRVWLDRAK